MHICIGVNLLSLCVCVCVCVAPAVAVLVSPIFLKVLVEYSYGCGLTC